MTQHQFLQKSKQPEFKISSSPARRLPQLPLFYLITLIRWLWQLLPSRVSWAAPRAGNHNNGVTDSRLLREQANVMDHSGPLDSIKSTINRSFIKPACEEIQSSDSPLPVPNDSPTALCWLVTNTIGVLSWVPSVLNNSSKHRRLIQMVPLIGSYCWGLVIECLPILEGWELKSRVKSRLLGWQ